MKKLSLYLFFSFLYVSISIAGEGLKGVYNFELVVENPKGELCKVTEQDIEREVKFVLSNTPIRLKKDINIEAIYISPTIIKLGDRCSGFIELEIWQGGVNTSSVGNKYVGKQVSYDQGYIYSAHLSKFKDGYLNAVNKITKNFVIKWREFN